MFYGNVAKRSGNDFFAHFVSKNDTKRRTHPVLCSVDVPLTYHNSIQRDTVRIAATVAVHFEFGSSFFQDCIYFSILLLFCQGFFSLFINRENADEIEFLSAFQFSSFQNLLDNPQLQASGENIQHQKQGIAIDVICKFGTAFFQYAYALFCNFGRWNTPCLNALYNPLKAFCITGIQYRIFAKISRRYRTHARRLSPYQVCVETAFTRFERSRIPSSERIHASQNAQMYIGTR